VEEKDLPDAVGLTDAVEAGDGEGRKLVACGHDLRAGLLSRGAGVGPAPPPI